MEPLKIFIRNEKYFGNLPAFYNPIDFPELKEISDNWKMIRDEVLEYEASVGFKGVQTYLPPEQGGENRWSNLYIDNFLWRSHSNRDHFPKTMKLVEKLNYYTYAAVSILLSEGEIKEHYGDTNGIIRCHLGLVIPSEDSEVCGISVNGELSNWEEGEFTMFTEAHLHYTWNYSKSKRYILVLDIVHPNYAQYKWRICSGVLSAQTINYLEDKLNILKKIPLPIINVFYLVIALLWRTYLPLQRKFKI